MVEAVERVADAARERGVRIALAESLTCGLLASEIGKGADAETWFAGAVIAYQTRTKQTVLGVAAGLDPVSAECAEQLASGARELMDADIAVSTTGIGGPGSEDGHAPGTVFLGWSTRDSGGHVRLSLDGSPDDVIARTVDEAVGLLDSLLARVGTP